MERQEEEVIAGPSGPPRRAQVARLLAFVLLASSGCDKTRAPAGPGAAAAATSAATAPTASSSAGTPSPARPLGDGCHAGVATAGRAAERAKQIAEACAPGSRLLGEVRELPGPSEVRLPLGEGPICVRVIAVAERADADLTLELVDEKGLIRAADGLPGSVALAGPRGPVCFASEAAVVARVGFAHGGGGVVVSAHRM